jgi:sodium-dependent phosphate cotransporter
MGANIGTTITNTIVSLGHLSSKREFRRAFAGAMMHDFFNSFSVIILFPIEMATGILQSTATKMAEFFYGSHASIEYHSPVKAAASIIPHYLKDVLVKGWHINEKAAGIILLALSFLLIFVTLVLFVKIMRLVMMSKIEQILNNFLNKSPFVGLAIGMIITAMVQSSSITTSLLIPLFGTGILSLEAAFPITLGANVGTTVTALLAALAGNMAGLIIAFVHLLFNMFGILIIYPVRKIRRIPLLAATLMARSAVKNKKILVLYILGFFFFLPVALIFISKLF